MSETVYQIYDKIFKKILTLSDTAVVNLINGLFGTDFPPDSKITHNWTEFEDKELRRILADTIVTVNGTHSYHMEAQMTKDEDIVFRVFEYGYSHADRNREETDDFHILHFPEPKIIYLSNTSNIPDKYILQLDFGSQGHFSYQISTFLFQEASIQELNDKKMIILIPFALLRLKQVMAKERSKDNFLALKNLILNDIIGNIEKNVQLGNITSSDAFLLTRLTKKLYDHIYSHYDELKEITEMTDESLIFDIDILEREYEEKFAKADAKLAEYREREKKYQEQQEKYREQEEKYRKQEEKYQQQEKQYQQQEKQYQQQEKQYQQEIARLQAALQAKS